jgi:hypothetical protein
VKLEPFLRWLAYDFLVREFMTKLLHRAGLEDLFRRSRFHSGQNNPEYA